MRDKSVEYIILYIRSARSFVLLSFYSFHSLQTSFKYELFHEFVYKMISPMKTRKHRYIYVYLYIYKK